MGDYMKRVSIYTDGSCDKEKVGGWAAVMMFGQHRREVSGCEFGTTSQRMEIRAVIEGIRQLKEPCHVDIYSDSKYVVNSHTKGWLNNWLSDNFKLVDGSDRVNADLWIELLAVSAIHNTRYFKVKGHSDNEWNNRCDWLAGMARRKGKGQEVG